MLGFLLLWNMPIFWFMMLFALGLVCALPIGTSPCAIAEPLRMINFSIACSSIASIGDTLARARTPR